MDDLKAIGVAAHSGMRAQTHRMKVVSENIANAETTATTPGGDPYRRKTVTFGEMVDRNSGARMVAVTGVVEDRSDFLMKYDPTHPMADAEGYIRMPNVNPMLELANMREAARSYEANLNLLDTGRRMRGQLVDMLN